MAHQLLLADDSVTIQRVVKLTFADEDVEVVAVGDGNQAVASIDRQPPDIVLADVAMPGRTGYEVAQHIRTSPRLAHIPVLLLTGAFEPVDEARASEVGCDGVLAKPFEPDVVVSRVKELLARPRPGTIAAPVDDAAPAPEPLSQPAVDPGALTVAEPFAATTPDSPPTRPPNPFTSDGAEPTISGSVAVGDQTGGSDVDAYFERLDQAFANLALSPRPAPSAGPESAEPPPSYPVVASVRESASGLPATLADAFAGLSTATPDAARGGSPVTPVEAPAFSDAQIDAIVDRVLQRLTERLGVNLADIVATVADRLVRAEIEEIKKRL
ncbi:MAG: response regulator [Vicinamibacterales bacterium]